jgi:hypothetical protein
MTTRDAPTKLELLSHDSATSRNRPATVARGKTSDAASAIDADEELRGANGKSWLLALPPRRSAMSHVGNGAVNGSRTRTTSHAAIDFENIAKVAAGTFSRKISASPDRSHGWASLAVSFTKTGKEQRVRAGDCLL